MTKPSSSIVESETVETAFVHLEECLAKILDLAPVKSVRLLVEMIPDLAPANQRLILVELIKVDMAMASELGVPRRIDFYLPELFDRLPVQDIPLDLVLEEIQLRRDAGEQPVVDEYIRRFPHLERPIKEMVSPPPADSTSIRVGKPPLWDIGKTIDDFVILSHLGRGAFAQVYLAKQESMQRLVALKVSVRGGEEPLALAQLDHPNIVRVYDQRLYEDPPLALLYMQYVAGGTLADVVKLANEKTKQDRCGTIVLQAIDQSLLAARQPPPEASNIRQLLAGRDWPTTVAWLGVQIAEGLGYSHGRGVLHRDVKPANVLLNAEGIPKLADFNVSHSGLTGRAGASAHFGGSLAYMSPEQLRAADARDQFGAADLDGRSDLYSLAILLWELWQGHRPWQTPASAESWSSALQQQATSRKAELLTPYRYGGAAERVLERVLRKAMSFDVEQRTRTGYEFAGRLRLALNPGAAARFEPTPKSLAGRLLRLPVIFVSACCILIPNGAAGAFNWLYNYQVIIKKRYPDMAAYFLWLADVVNVIAFPMGAALLIWFSLEVHRALKRAEQDEVATTEGLEATWHLGLRAALIGGVIWMVAGMVYPIALRWKNPDFATVDCCHFFLSLVFCGGVAWIYPFFGLTLIAVAVFYPKLVSPSMLDPDFPKRAQRLRIRSTIYLASAAVIPLLALALLIPIRDAEPMFLLSTVVTTGLGLFASFAAYHKIGTVLTEIGQVLAIPRPQSVVTESNATVASDSTTISWRTESDLV